MLLCIGARFIGYELVHTLIQVGSSINMHLEDIACGGVGIHAWQSFWSVASENVLENEVCKRFGQTALVNTAGPYI